MVFIRDTMVRGGTYSVLKVEYGRKYFVNVGSVGQSRDGVPKATYPTYDLDSDVIELRHLDYPNSDSGGDRTKGPMPIPSGGKPPCISGADQIENKQQT